jgi:hypothetical protein
MSPDFKLAKFYKYARRGVDLRKDADAAGDDSEWWKSSERLLQYAETMVKASFTGASKNTLLDMAKAKKRVGPREWRKVMAEPAYQAAVKSVMRNPELTEAMNCAILALVA